MDDLTGVKATVEIQCCLLHSLKGSDAWVEGVLYAAVLGTKIGLGDCLPTTPDAVVRMESAPYSGYEYQGTKDFSGSLTRVPTIQLEEGLLLEPKVALNRSSRLSAICAVAAHEALHHRVIVEIDGFIDTGYGGELEAEFSSERRKIILELLGVNHLITESGADPRNLDRYWSANGHTWKLYFPEQNLLEAELNARNEFLGQVAACLARIYIKNGPDEVRRFVTSQSDKLESEADRVIPLPYVCLLEKVIEGACSPAAEIEAVRNVIGTLGRSPISMNALLSRLRP